MHSVPSTVSAQSRTRACSCAYAFSHVFSEVSHFPVKYIRIKANTFAVPSQHYCSSRTITSYPDLPHEN